MQIDPFEKTRGTVHMQGWSSRLMVIGEKMRVEPLLAMCESDARAEVNARMVRMMEVTLAR